jgi:hypothetical protein
MSDAAGPHKTTSSGADARARSETATLVFAVTVAVALGVACGIWVNSLMASSAAAGRAARPRTEPEVAPPADARGTTRGAAETAAVEEPAAAVVEGRVLQPAATPAVREASPRPKADARAAATQEPERSTAATGKVRRASPCALYASASSLNMRGGGAASLVVGGPGRGGTGTVSTPNWADIAVLYEGPAAGRNGWVRYTVKSVSRRPGLYTVRFATSCGSQTIPVTVR